MKAFRNLPVPVLAIAIASAAVQAQEQASEDAVNPQNRDPVSSYQGDQANANRSSGSVQREASEHTATSEASSVLSAAGAGIAFEQLARSRPEQLQGIPVVAASGMKLGEIDKIVTKDGDTTVYAFVARDSGSPTAVRLSQLEIQTLSYAGSIADLQQQPYEEDGFEPVNMLGAIGERQLGQEGAKNSNSLTASRGGAASEDLQAGAIGGLRAGPADGPLDDERSTTGGRSGDATFTRSLAGDGAALPSDAAQPLVTALAMSRPALVEGARLIGDHGEELGSIEQIVRSTTDAEYYAVVIDSQNHNQAMVKLDELNIAGISHTGDHSDLEQNLRESDYQEVSRN